MNQGSRIRPILGGPLLPVLLLLSVLWPFCPAQARAPDLILSGALRDHDHQTYREIPFQVPEGVQRLTLEFSYTGKDQKTTLDLGLRDPVRFRGWSGGNKNRVVIEGADATPSYLSGPIPPGKWQLVIGVPNLRSGAKATFTAKVWLDRVGTEFTALGGAAQGGVPGWYRGDLHAHTGHSDGSCQSARGQRVPCPVFKTLEAARRLDLDFLAITDHNAVSQNQALAELAPYFDDLLLIPGREITTFQGHANIWGPSGDLDFQLGSARARTFEVIQDQAHAAHGLISINHPGLPSGEACMGCGWTAPTDWSKVDAIEVVNGGSLAVLGAEGPVSGIPFWENLLNQGFRITAVGGSDNHDPDLAVDKPGGFGRPITYVRADALAQADILEAIRKGRVFVDVLGLPAPRLEVEARSGVRVVEMGGVVTGRAGDPIVVKARVTGAPQGARLYVRGSAALGQGQREWPVTEEGLGITLTHGGASTWLRFDVRDEKGALILLGNPIYLRPKS